MNSFPLGHDSVTSPSGLQSRIAHVAQEHGKSVRPVADKCLARPSTTFDGVPCPPIQDRSQCLRDRMVVSAHHARQLGAPLQRLDDRVRIRHWPLPWPQRGVHHLVNTLGHAPVQHISNHDRRRAEPMDDHGVSDSHVPEPCDHLAPRCISCWRCTTGEDMCPAVATPLIAPVVAAPFPPLRSPLRVAAPLRRRAACQSRNVTGSGLAVDVERRRSDPRHGTRKRVRNPREFSATTRTTFSVRATRRPVPHTIRGPPVRDVAQRVNDLAHTFHGRARQRHVLGCPRYEDHAFDRSCVEAGNQRIAEVFHANLPRSTGPIQAQGRFESAVATKSNDQNRLERVVTQQRRNSGDQFARTMKCACRHALYGCPVPRTEFVRRAHLWRSVERKATGDRTRRLAS